VEVPASVVSDHDVSRVVDSRNGGGATEVVHAAPCDSASGGCLVRVSGDPTNLKDQFGLWSFGVFSGH
jgi:hypothetical protein